MLNCGPMTLEEKAAMDALCIQITGEKDPHTFTRLVQQLNDLLELKEKRLESKPKPD